MIGRPRLVTSIVAAMTPEREALAVAIAEHSRAIADHAASVQAGQAADRAVLDAHQAIEAAETGLGAAKAAAGHHAIAVACGCAGDPPQTIRQAREQLAEAQDALEVITAARTAIKAAVVTAEGRPALARAKLERAAKAVVASEAAERFRVLEEDAHRLHVAFSRTQAALRWLRAAGCSDPAAPSRPLAQQVGLDADAEVRAAWDERLRALMADAGAHFPLEV